MAVQQDTMLSLDDVAERLNTSRRSVIRLKDSGTLPSFKFGGVVRVSQRDLEQFIARSRHPDAAPVEPEPPTPRRRRRSQVPA